MPGYPTRPKDRVLFLAGILRAFWGRQSPLRMRGGRRISSRCFDLLSIQVAESLHGTVYTGNWEPSGLSSTFNCRQT